MQTIRRMFLASLAALVGGAALLLIAGLLGYLRGVLIMRGPDVVGIRPEPFSWTMIALAVVAVLVMVAAIVVQFVAWIAAMVNAARLENKAWFVLLLVTGLLSFGLAGMVIYLIAAPEAEPSDQGHAVEALGRSAR